MSEENASAKPTHAEEAEAPAQAGPDVAALADAGVEPELAEMVAPDREIAAKVGENIVEVKNLTIKFGGLVALDNISFNIKRGEILGLIGHN
jgi:branched-chain amino acid transport system ATP-binding protein